MQPSLNGQQYYDFGFERDYTVKVLDSNGVEYKDPWIGGMNSCHFSSVDLNLDGIQDLCAFDKDGNKVLCYINDGNPGSVDYTYSPQYVSLLPRFEAWVNFIDYNCDGKKDIFTYTTGGIMVFINTSDTILKFKKAVDKYLLSYQFGGYTNIWVTYADYPAFSDIDYDGDIDVLTFGVLGSWLGYHKNLSMEKYGNCDSLDFILDEYSWGCFAESEESNIITLDTCYASKDPFPQNDIKHVGSTLLAIDLDGDDDKDLIFGDVDYSNVIQLINGGTKDSAYMISQDTAFPSYDIPVDLISFPVLCNVDVNNDNVRDLIVAPFDPSLDKSKNYRNILFYANHGSDDNPDFVFQSDNFLQSDMIDVGAGAYPVFFDYDNDGLDDLVVANFGYLDSSYYDIVLALHCTYRSQLALYRNTGTNNSPSFRLISKDFAGLSELNLMALYPAFADLDGDGDVDMLVGDYNGNVHYFENIAGTGNISEFVLSELNYQGIDVGDFCTPQLVDLDRDSKIDLVCGKRSGRLSWYRNTGSLNSPVFTFVSDDLGGVDVTDNQNPYHAYSVPCFFKDDNDNFKLFVGSVSGHLHYYKNIDNNLDGAFTLDNENYLWLYDGIMNSVTVSDLNEDGYPDMIMGNYSGGLAYYKGVEPPMIGIDEKSYDDAIDIFPNPAEKTIRIINQTGKKIEKIQIFNSLGKLMICINKFENSIDIANLPAGVYFVCLITGNSKTTKKLIVLSSH